MVHCHDIVVKLSTTNDHVTQNIVWHYVVLGELQRRLKVMNKIEEQEYQKCVEILLQTNNIDLTMKNESGLMYIQQCNEEYMESIATQIVKKMITMKIDNINTNKNNNEMNEYVVLMSKVFFHCAKHDFVLTLHIYNYSMKNNVNTSILVNKQSCSQDNNGATPFIIACKKGMNSISM